MSTADIELVNTIKDELILKKNKNKYYSLRSFARDLGVSPSYLSKILSFKVPITSNFKLRVQHYFESNRFGNTQLDSIKHRGLKATSFTL